MEASAGSRRAGIGELAQRAGMGPAKGGAPRRGHRARAPRDLRRLARGAVRLPDRVAVEAVGPAAPGHARPRGAVAPRARRAPRPARGAARGVGGHPRAARRRRATPFASRCGRRRARSCSCTTIPSGDPAPSDEDVAFTRSVERRGGGRGHAAARSRDRRAPARDVDARARATCRSPARSARTYGVATACGATRCEGRASTSSRAAGA